MLRHKIKTFQSSEDLFVERYAQLLAWALALTGQNRELAEDLVHDTFIQFTLNRPDLPAIGNLDGYLYACLRNMRLSQVRRASRVQQRSISIAEYDSATIVLRAPDLCVQLQTYEDLRLVCRYAIMRKETSKAGAALILRFFYDYYADEIARIMRCPRPALNQWLLLARREAKIYLTEPERLKFMSVAAAPNPRLVVGARSDDFLDALRQEIYRYPSGECLSRRKLRELYAAAPECPIECATLAHLVSCRNCLDEVNRLLGLPPIFGCSPTDTPDLGASKPAGGGDGGGPAVGPRDAKVMKYLRRMKEIEDHQPRELHISVNGFELGSQRVVAGQSDQTLSVNLPEPISFVEVFSEQGVRLMFVDVDPPPGGGVEQRARVSLSDEREMALTLKFGGPWPELRITYHDTAYKEETDVSPEALERSSPNSDVVETRFPVESWRDRFRKRFRPDLRGLGGAQFWLRPGVVTTVLALLIACAVFLIRMPAPPVTAARLLERSSDVEKAMLSRTDAVLHRTINLEEKQPGSQLVIKRRIEVWHSAERGVTARRVYDERNQLSAGEWRRKEGVRTLYRKGSQPQLQPVTEKRDGGGLGFDDVWQLEPSAMEFAGLIGDPETARLEETPAAFIIRFDSRPESRARGLMKASLTLSRADMRAIEQTLVVRQGSEEREYRLAETSFERRSANSVAPAVFEPEPELLGAATSPSLTPGTLTTDPISAARTPAPAVATAGLEVEALRLLSQAGADLGEQISVTRTPEGALRVEGIVETDRRKEEILRALAPIKDNPAVRVAVRTVAEALRDQKSRAEPGPIVVQGAEPSAGALLVDAELRRFFSARGLTGQRLEESISQFADQTLNRSLQVMRHAWALKRLAQRFSQEELRSLDAEARAKWLAMVRQHAQSLQRQTGLLKEHLLPIFPNAAVAGDTAAEEIRDDAGLVHAIERLFEVCAANDRVTRRAFAVTSEASGGAAIRTEGFWRALSNAEMLAAKIASVSH
jgi:DNA-directed RNA polymerase specialized sigma24 family protein